MSDGLGISQSIVSGQTRVTAAGGAAVVVSGEVSLRGQSNFAITQVSGNIPVTGGGTPLPTLASVSGDVRITAAGAPITISANAPGGVQGAIRGDAIYNALVSNPVKYGKVAAVAGAVCADIVAGVASRRIRVLGAAFFSTGTATAIFLTTGASAALTPKIPMANGFVLPTNEFGWFETAVGSALTLQVEAGTVGGVVCYQEVF